MEPLKDLEKSGLLDKLPPGVQPFTLFNNCVRPLDLAPDEIESLAQGMRLFHPQGASTLSGYTYLGQFLAHDTSRLRAGRHDLHAIPFACEELVSTVSCQLDLSSVYSGATAESSLRVPRSAYMRLGKALSDNGDYIYGYDLPRHEGKAQIADDRNDENLITAQLHLQFLRLHNFFVSRIEQEEPALDTESLFLAAKEQVVLHYQHIILYDFLFEVIHPTVWKALVYHEESIVWDTESDRYAMLSMEFAGAVGRFGHSMVRKTYELNKHTGVKTEELFDQTGKGSIDGRNEEYERLTTPYLIDWLLFFDFSKLTSRAPRPPEPNRGSCISPRIAFKLKHADSMPCEANLDLAERNLRRAEQLGVGSAQDMVDYYLSCHSEKLNKHKIILQKLDDEALGKNWENPPLKNCERLYCSTPLWYYILAEAYQEKTGQVSKLGVLGSLILAESIMGLLKLDSTSILHNTNMRCDIAGTKCIGNQKFLQMSDLIFAATPCLPDPTRLTTKKENKDEC